MDEIISGIVHDRFVHAINVDFIKKETRFLFGENLDTGKPPTFELIFKDVVWQDLRELDMVNIYNMIMIDRNFPTFLRSEAAYIATTGRYFPRDLLQNLENDNTLTYYYFYPTVGVGGFVICRDVEVIEFS